MTGHTDHSALGILKRRAYEALVKEWQGRTRNFKMANKDGRWLVRATVYHDMDRAPSYYTHPIVMNDLEEHVAAKLLADLEAR